jgi:NAD+ diphosphatase
VSVFLALVDPPGPGEGEALILRVRDRDVSIAEGEGPEGAIFLGTLDGRHCWAVPVEGDGGEEEYFVDLRRLWGTVADDVWTLAGRAVQLVDWARTHRYCGRCATPTERSPGERAMKCPACGLVAFPRLAPAIIVLIEREDGRALLARNVRFPGSMYSCLAGFVEPGETLEEAVRREVREEVGVELGEVRYWDSQPWPFPHSLMLGFLAQYDSGEIVCAPDEIADARWFEREEIPAIPPGISIARRLIDQWLERGD